MALDFSAVSATATGMTTAPKSTIMNITAAILRQEDTLPNVLAFAKLYHVLLPPLPGEIKELMVNLQLVMQTQQLWHTYVTAIHQGRRTEMYSRQSKAFITGRGGRNCGRVLSL